MSAYVTNLSNWYDTCFHMLISTNCWRSWRWHTRECYVPCARQNKTIAPLPKTQRILNFILDNLYQIIHIYPEPPFGTQKLVPLYFCSVQFFMLVSYGEKKCVRVFVSKLWFRNSCIYIDIFLGVYIHGLTYHKPIHSQNPHLTTQHP